MLERLLKLIALLLSVTVGLGWLLFAIDETSAASQQSRDEILGQQATRRADPTPDEERARERTHGAVREAIDDANDVLLKPFAFVTKDSPSKWVRRSIPAVLALLVYGFGLAVLATFARGRR